MRITDVDSVEEKFDGEGQARVPILVDEYYDDLEEINEERLDRQEEAPGSYVNGEIIEQDAHRVDTWLSYNKGTAHQGFSPAYQLTPDNVSDLELVWEWEADTPGLETSIIVTPSDPPVAYFTLTSQGVVALNARTGEEYWEYSWESDTNPAGSARGAAVFGDHVVATMADCTVIGLDRYTGELDWETSLLMDDPELPQTNDRVYSSQSGHMGPDGTYYHGQSNDRVGWSVVSAVDAESGEIKWQQRTAPKSEWVEDTWKFASGGSWLPPAIDTDLNLGFFPIGNPDPFFAPYVRPGPNAMTSGVLALDLESGDIEWFYQVAPHDNWDYDVSNAPALADVRLDGERRRAVIQDWKGAWTYILDAETGQLLDRTENWATQRHEFGFSDDSYLNMVPLGEENSGHMQPGVCGATKYCSNTYNPMNGMRYIGYQDMTPADVWGDRDWEYGPDNYDFWGGEANGVADQYESEVGVAAIDIESGNVAWKWNSEDFDDSVAGYCAYFPGGVISTAGGLLFTGTPGGMLNAVDTETGELAWQDNAEGGRITATPATWQDAGDGRQFVAVASDERVVAYAGGGFSSSMGGSEESLTR